ncbi:SGNH hydrolase domain-containing protein [Kitasatospora aureofaciens]|uniref:DUF459 domain-containing protein n=1 Tax=Kitasatospora aureofaciens TaxID=1894 RepID=UPI0037FC5172
MPVLREFRFWCGVLLIAVRLGRKARSVRSSAGRICRTVTLAALLSLGVPACSTASDPGALLSHDALSPGTRDMTILVVGDSWARSFGVGMNSVGKSQNNTIVNAAQGGCGIMLSAEEEVGKKRTPTPTQCNAWPTEWPKLIDQHKPQAVLLSTSFWDQAAQVIDDSGKLKTIDAPDFQKAYAVHLDQALELLGRGGARVFLTTTTDGDPGPYRTKSDAMNKAVRAAVARNAAKGTSLLSVRDQLCDDSGCPREIHGIQVYDDTGHPTKEAQDRLGAWMLDAMHEAVGQHQGSEPSA